MKSIILAVSILITFSSFTNNSKKKNFMDAIFKIQKAAKYNIKIKNDSGEEVTVYNAGSGGIYRLTKNTITIIKMEDEDKLYNYDAGKKGRLLLTASADMDGKVQLYSKL